MNDLQEKPPRARIFWVDAHPYSYRLHVCIGGREQGTRWLKRQGVLNHDLTGDVACTCVPETDNSGARVCIWLHPEQKTSALVHELVHAAVEILRGSGVPITAQSDEALAYLVERLFIEVQWRWMRPVGSK